jgi:hypothetical protein
MPSKFTEWSDEDACWFIKHGDITVKFIENGDVLVTGSNLTMRLSYDQDERGVRCRLARVAISST